VAHPVHQLAGGGAAGRGEGVPGVPEIVEMDVTEAGCLERAEPDPAEVVAMEDTAAGPDEVRPAEACSARWCAVKAAKRIRARQ
jgi:hypothetical protein